MKNRYLLAASLLAVFAVFTIGCDSSGDGDGAEEQILPTKFMIKIPESLGTGDPALSVRGSARATSSEMEEMFADQLMTDIKIIRGGASKVVTYMVGFNATLVQNSLTPSDTAHTNVQVTISAQHIQDIKDICAEAGLEPDIFFEAGDTFPIDSLLYSTVSDGTYDYMIKAVVQGDEEYIYWSEDKSKVKVASVINNMIDPEIDYLENHFSYDDALEGSCFLIYQENADGSKSEVPIKLRKDTTSSLVGVYVGDICMLTPPPDPEFPTNINIWMHGYADNSGGGFKTESNLFGTFDATGALTGTDISTSSYKGRIDDAKTQIDAITTLTPIRE